MEGLRDGVVRHEETRNARHRSGLKTLSLSVLNNVALLSRGYLSPCFCAPLRLRILLHLPQEDVNGQYKECQARSGVVRATCRCSQQRRIKTSAMNVREGRSPRIAIKGTFSTSRSGEGGCLVLRRTLRSTGSVDAELACDDPCRCVPCLAVRSGADALPVGSRGHHARAINP
eukprot:scaffold2527_cov241-Pinguiococcus_pyrenoidosus.AAC.2